VKLLLDTHIWLWSLGDPKRIGRRLQRELRNPMNELWLSPVSTWEALALHDEGRIKLEGDLQEWMAKARAPFLEAPVTHEVVVAARRVPLPRQNLADRLLAATALVLDLTLVSADGNLLGLGEIATLGNR
jgi:PIN domain nuclease of toxin-antitoxin system